MGAWFRKAIYLPLACATALVVIWSYASVGLRLWREHDPADQRVQLVVMGWGDTSEARVVRTLVEDYEREHPNVKITVIHAAEDYDSKIATMLSAGTPPDLFYLAHERVPEFVDIKAVADLTPFIDKLPEKQRWLDGYYPVLLNAFRYDGQSIGKGPLYGIPKDWTTMLMYVNCDLFKRAGIAVPYNGWTWDEFEKDCRKISALPSDAAGRFYGGALDDWSSALLEIVESFGGDYFRGSDFRDMIVDSPDSLAALEMMQRTRFVDKSVYPASGPKASDDGQQLFFTGRVGVVGPIGRWEGLRYRGNGEPGITDFAWDVVPLPFKYKPTAGIDVSSWSMAAASKHPQEAFDLLRFLTGRQGQELAAHIGMSFPSLREVAAQKWIYFDKPVHDWLFVDSLKYANLPQFPGDMLFDQLQRDELGACIQLNQTSPAEAAKRLKQRWLAAMDSPLKRSDYPVMNWWRVGAGAGVVLAVFAFITWGFARKEKLSALDRKIERTGWMFISPWVLGFVTMTLGPMAMSLLLSLTQWTSMMPVTNARFVGLENYRQMAFHDGDILPSIRVTAYYALLAVPIGQVAALGVALLMNSRVRGIGIYRTIYFLPTLVGGVTMAAIWKWLLNNDYGLINRLLWPVARFFGTSPPDWIEHDAVRWAIPAFVLMSLWTVGGGMLTYLAALKNVPLSLYEAARLDGASRLRQFLAVTVPMISPLIFFNLIMAIIGSFQIFSQVYVMTDGGPGNATLVYVIYLFRQAFLFHNMGYASAMAWLLFLIVFVLTIMVMRGSRRWVYYEGLKA
jgi:multiple sugar transport system permease protein